MDEKEPFAKFENLKPYQQWMIASRLNNPPEFALFCQKFLQISNAKDLKEFLIFINAWSESGAFARLDAGLLSFCIVYRLMEWEYCCLFCILCKFTDCRITSQFE